MNWFWPDSPDDSESKWPQPIRPNPRRRYTDSLGYRIWAVINWCITHGLAALAGGLYLAPAIWTHGCH